MSGSVPVAPVVPQQEPGNISSLTPAAPFLFSPALPAQGEKCFKFLSHLAAVGYPRTRNECEGESQSLSENTITEKNRPGKKKKRFDVFFFPSRCDFLFFHVLSESRLRVMHARCYWGMCFLFVACRRGLFYLSRGWRRIPSQSTTRGSGQKAKPRGERRRTGGK